jgi:hypothetical protein
VVFTGLRQFRHTSFLVDLVLQLGQSAAEGLDARRIPAGEIGQGAIVDFAVVGLAKENAGARVAIGDGGDVHADQIQQLLVYMKNNLSFT